MVVIIAVFALLLSLARIDEIREEKRKMLYEYAEELRKKAEDSSGEV